MARYGYVEWYSADDPMEMPEATPFADPEVRARMAAFIVRAAQGASRQEDFDTEPRSTGGRSDRS